MYKSLFNRKAVVIAVGFALAICLFLGCFAHAPVNMDKSFTNKYWFYINRGYPVAWSGVSLNDRPVELPLVKAPFLHKEKFSKVIDLSIFLPLFMVIFLLSYLPAFIFAKSLDENKQLFPFFILLNIIVFGMGLFIYFSWFTRI